MSTYAFNKRARFDYEITDTYEAGIVLLGYEVKSIKTGHINLKGAFVTLKNIKDKEIPEVYLINCHIPLYKHAGIHDDYDPYQSRKLLLKKSEIKQLIGKKQEKGLTIVPIRVYNKGNLIKVEIGLGTGKKKIDKREAIKKRETDRNIRRLTKQY